MNALVIQECVPCWICHLIKLEYVAKMYYKIIKHVKRISEMIKAEENKVLKKKTFSSATSSTTNSTCTSLGSNLGFHCQGS